MFVDIIKYFAQELVEFAEKHKSIHDIGMDRYEDLARLVEEIQNIKLGKPGTMGAQKLKLMKDGLITAIRLNLLRRIK